MNKAFIYIVLNCVSNCFWNFGFMLFFRLLNIIHLTFLVSYRKQFKTELDKHMCKRSKNVVIKNKKSN